MCPGSLEPAAKYNRNRQIYYAPLAHAKKNETHTQHLKKKEKKKSKTMSTTGIHTPRLEPPTVCQVYKYFHPPDNHE